MSDKDRLPDNGDLIGGGVPEDSEGQTQVFKAEPEPDATIIRPVERVREEAEPAPEEAKGDELPAPVKKRRHRPRRTGCLGAVLYFVFVVSTSLLIAVLLWMAANDVLALAKPEMTAEVTIEKTDGIGDIAAKLKEAGLIDYISVFRVYARFSHAEEKIQPGTYTLSTTYDYRALVANMKAQGRTYETVDVTIPEGYSVKQIFKLLEDKGVCLSEDLYTIAADYDFEYDFLEGLEDDADNRLEGYLFPDTYQFYLDDDPVSVIKTILKNFDRHYDEEVRAQVEASGRSLREILTIASIIEKEVSAGTERELVSSVIYNRLSSSYRRLEIDATVIYALGGDITELSLDDLDYDSPYNTYMYEGLPPGPISNPGMATITAALSPADTNYYFYALQGDGTHHFSATFEEHQAFLASQSSD